MSTILNPYLHFAGTTREAMEFYQSVFGGELSVMTYGDMGMEGEAATQVMHSALRHDAAGVVLFASDFLPGMGHDTMPPNGHIALSGDEDGVLRGWFDGLSAGGTVNVELARQPWGDVFGDVTDKYGLTWLVNIADPT